MTQQETDPFAIEKYAFIKYIRLQPLGAFLWDGCSGLPKVNAKQQEEFATIQKISLTRNEQGKAF